MNDIILVSHQNFKTVENEEKVKWLRSILSKMSIPLDNWPENPSMNDLRKMRKLLLSQGVQIIDDNNEGLLIYVGNDLVAEWRKPNYVLKKDINERDPRYRTYLEMHLKRRPVIEETEDLVDDLEFAEEDK